MMCLGLNYIHSLGFVHRDISTNNLLLKKKKHGEGYWLLVADFGLARNLSDKATKSTVNHWGNSDYCPPEHDENAPPIPNDKRDSWSSGIVLY
jgi:serine/threonine protein kinase